MLDRLLSPSPGGSSVSLMETIYRVESKRTGNGWYNHGHDFVEGWEGSEVRDLLWDMHVRSEDRDRHPHPTLDGIPSFGGHHFFGFVLLEELLDWFAPTGAIEAIKDGPLSDWFCIVAYDVAPEYVLYGHTQCAFEREHAVGRREVSV